MKNRDPAMSKRGGPSDVTDCGAPDQPVTPPAAVAEPFLDIQWLDLSSRDLLHSIGELEGIRTVRHIGLRNARNTDGESLRRLAELCPETRVLDLRACRQLRGEDLTVLSAFQHLAAVKLGDNPQLDDRAIEGLLACDSLTFLELVNATGLSGRAIDRLANVRTLESVLLGGATGVDDECVRQLSALTELRDLRLVRCPIGNRAVADLGRCRKLRHLNLNGCDRLGDEAVAAVSACRELVELRLSGCHSLTDRVWRYLAKLPGLGALSMSGAYKASDRGANVLARCSCLQEFRARGCSRLGDGTADALSHCRRLRILDASGWEGLTQRGTEAIARLPRLEECAVSGLDDNGVGAFGAATTLRMLALRRCGKVTPKAFARLAGLVQLQTLALLDGTRGDAEVLESLHALPALREVVIERPRGAKSTDEETSHMRADGFPFRIIEAAAETGEVVPAQLMIASDR